MIYDGNTGQFYYLLFSFYLLLVDTIYLMFMFCVNVIGIICAGFFLMDV